MAYYYPVEIKNEKWIEAIDLCSKIGHVNSKMLRNVTGDKNSRRILQNMAEQGILIPGKRETRNDYINYTLSEYVIDYVED